MHDLGLIDWYQMPTWYDVLHEKGTAAEVDGLERLALRYCCTRRRAGEAPVWYEPACGTGRFLKVAAGRGVRTIGVDSEPAMIDYARKRFAQRGLDGVFRAGDMTKFVSEPRADLAFCTVNSVRHLASDRAMLEHFGAARASLRTGGVYVVGLNTTTYGAEMPSEDVWTGRRGALEVTQVANYLPAPAAGSKPRERERFETVINHLVAVTPGGETHADNRYRLRCYSMEQWRRLIARSPFEVVAAADEFGGVLAEGDDAFDVAGYALWVLRAGR